MHLETDEVRQSGYMFIERRTEEKLDASGRSRDESVKVFEVYPGLPGEDSYRRLIQEDGKPVPPSVLERQDRERKKAVEAYAQKLATTAGRQQDDRRREHDRQRYRAAVDDLFRLYDIHMVQ